MVNMITHWGDANQNTVRCPFSSTRMAIIVKIDKNRG